MTMPTMAALAATLLGGATLPFALNTPVSTAPSRTTLTVPVNGDFNQFLPEHRSNYRDELRQHTARLRAIEGVLRLRDVNDLPVELRAERARNLDRLHAYWVRAEYPTVSDHSGPVRPCFIDDAGRICAVGYLVEQSAGRDAAERINAKYRPNTIREIDDPALASWIASSGLSYDEVVAIQGPEMREPSRILSIKESDVRSIQDRSASGSSRRGLRVRGRNGQPATVATSAVTDQPAPLRGARAGDIINAEPAVTVPVNEPTSIEAVPVTDAAPSVRTEPAAPPSDIQ